MRLMIDDVNFSQLSINECFKDKRWISQLVEDFLTGRVTLQTLPRIPVVFCDGKWFAIDGNRRLFVLKKLHERGLLGTDEIPVKRGRLGRRISYYTNGYVRVRHGGWMAKEIDAMINDFQQFGRSTFTPGTLTVYWRMLASMDRLSLRG